MLYYKKLFLENPPAVFDIRKKNARGLYIVSDYIATRVQPTIGIFWSFEVAFALATYVSSNVLALTCGT